MSVIYLSYECTRRRYCTIEIGIHQNYTDSNFRNKDLVARQAFPFDPAHCTSSAQYSHSEHLTFDRNMVVR